MCLNLKLPIAQRDVQLNYLLFSEINVNILKPLVTDTEEKNCISIYKLVDNITYSRKVSKRFQILGVYVGHCFTPQFINPLVDEYCSLARDNEPIRLPE